MSQKGVGEAICRILGIDPNMVTGITMQITPDSPNAAIITVGVCCSEAVITIIEEAAAENGVEVYEIDAGQA